MGHKSTEMIDKYYARWLKNDAQDYTTTMTGLMQDSLGLKIAECPWTSLEPRDESQKLLQKLNKRPELMQLLSTLISDDKKK